MAVGEAGIRAAEAHDIGPVVDAWRSLLVTHSVPL
jgi:hypothetical protein